MDSSKAIDLTDSGVILDYMAFGRTVLPRQALALFNVYNQAAEERERRALAVALVSTWMQQYEQLGAWLLAIKNATTQQTTVLATIRSYSPGQADLSLVARNFTSVDMMAAQLGLDVANITATVGHQVASGRLEDLRAGLSESISLQAAYKSFYNKSKHGMLILFDSGNGVGPCALDKDEAKLHCIEWTDEQARAAASQVHRLAQVAVDLLGLFLISRDPALLQLSIEAATRPPGPSMS